MLDLDLHRDAIAAGDPEAFGFWVAGCERPLRESLRSFATAVDTEAVVQEALLRVWQVAPRFVPDGAPNGLLRLGIRIARNLAVSETRRLRTRPAPLAGGGEDGMTEGMTTGMTEAMAEPTPSDPFLRGAVHECREKLPGKPALALTARLQCGGGEPDATLAERLGMTLNTFLQNFTRARRLLLDCLRGRGIDVDKELA